MSVLNIFQIFNLTVTKKSVEYVRIIIIMYELC